MCALLTDHFRLTLVKKLFNFCLAVSRVGTECRGPWVKNPSLVFRKHVYGDIDRGLKQWEGYAVTDCRVVAVFLNPFGSSVSEKAAFH